MWHTPKCLEEAKGHRYNKWAGNPIGSSYIEGRCAFEVSSQFQFFQCARKNGYGAAGLYCKQHAKRCPAETSDAK